MSTQAGLAVPLVDLTLDETVRTLNFTMNIAYLDAKKLKTSQLFAIRCLGTPSDDTT